MSITKIGKKILGLLAVMVLAFTFVGCQPTEQNANKANALELAEDIKSKIFWDATSMEEITDSLTLITKTKYDTVTVSWASSAPDVISTSGKVTRPLADDERAVASGENKVVEVKLVATITATYSYTKDGQTVNDKVFLTSNEFKFTVLCLAEGIHRGTITELKTAAAKFIYEESGVGPWPDSNSKVVFPVQFYGVVTTKLFASGAGQMYVSDGTEGIYVFKSNEDVQVGDTVFVTGDIYSYYGNLQVGANVSVEKTTEETINLPEKETVVISDWYKTWDDKTGYIGGTYLTIYAKLVKEQAPAGSGQYKLVDPYSGEEVWIYYKSYDETMKAELDALDGKYVNISGVSYDFDSRINKLQICFNGEIEEASAPVLTDEEKATVILNQIALPEEAVENFLLPSENAVWEVVSGEGIVIETIESALTAVVTRGAADQTIVLKVTITVGEAVLTKEFTVKVLSAIVPYVSAKDANDACLDAARDGETIYVKAYIREDSKLDKYGNMVLEDLDGNSVVIYGGFGKNSTGEYIFPTLVTELGLVPGLCIGVKGEVGTQHKNVTGKEIVEVFPEDTVIDVKTALERVALEENDTKTCVVKGVIAAGSKLDKYGNMILEDAEGKQLVIYGGFGKDAEGNYLFPGLITKYGLAEGVTVIVKGTYGKQYGNVTGKEILFAEAPATDADKVSADLNTIQLDTEVIENFVLPVTGTNGATFAWSVKSGTGIAIETVSDVLTAVVTRTAENQTVVLTCVATLGEANESKDFTVVVKTNAAPKYTGDFLTCDAQSGYNPQAFNVSEKAWSMNCGQLSNGVFFLGWNKAAAATKAFLADKYVNALNAKNASLNITNETLCYANASMEFDVTGAKSVTFNYSYIYELTYNAYILVSVDGGVTYTCLTEEVLSTKENGSISFTAPDAYENARFALIINGPKSGTRVKLTTIEIY